MSDILPQHHSFTMFMSCLCVFEGAKKSPFSKFNVFEEWRKGRKNKEKTKFDKFSSLSIFDLRQKGESIHELCF